MSEKAAPKTIQVVTFSIKGRHYAIEVGEDKSMKEIVKNDQEITVISGAPEFVLGVVNLRGQVVPILNLGQLLGFTDCEVKLGEGFVLILLDGPNGKFGLTADQVYQIHTIDSDYMEEPTGVLDGNNFIVRLIKELKGSAISGIVTLLDPMKIYARCVSREQI